MECDANGRERMMELRLKGTPCNPPRTSNDHYLPMAARVGSTALGEVMYGGSVATYALGGRPTQLHPFSSTVLLPGCRWRLGGRLDGARAAARYFDAGEQANASDWTAPHEAAVAAADHRVRDRAWCSYFAGAIGFHMGPETLRTLLARATTACGTLPLSCRLVHLCAQPTPAAARLLIDTLPANGGALAHCAWVAAAALADQCRRREVLQHGVQWMMSHTGHEGSHCAAALDLWLRLLDGGPDWLQWNAACIDAVLACRAAPDAGWAAERGKCIRHHGMGHAVWPVCLHVLLTGALPPVARWRLGYAPQPLTLHAVDKGAPLAGEVVGVKENDAVVGRVWAAVLERAAGQRRDSCGAIELHMLLHSSHVAAVPMWAPPRGVAEGTMGRALAQVPKQSPLSALHSLLACARAALHSDAAAEMQGPRVLALVTQSIAQALTKAGARGDTRAQAALGSVGTQAAHALIASVQALPLLQPLGGSIVQEPWPLSPLQCPWMPLPTLDGTALALGLQPLLLLLPVQARVACLEHMADLTPMPGCVPELLLDTWRAHPGAQARSWMVPLVAGAAAAARPPCVAVLNRVVRLLEADGLYQHAAAELRELVC